MSDEFIILNLGSDSAKVGSSCTILGVSSTEEEARARLAELPTSTASKVAILEKRSVIRRVPTVRLEDLTENIIA